MYTSCYLWYIWYNMQLYAFTTGHQKWETAQKRSSCGAGCGPLSSLITKPCWSACELQPPSSTRWPRIGKANARRCRAKVATGVGLPSTSVCRIRHTIQIDHLWWSVAVHHAWPRRPWFWITCTVYILPCTLWDLGYTTVTQLYSNHYTGW